jgi:class 3 adenylate cyclase/tetratricopeptide (TPR) repeat protein
MTFDEVLDRVRELLQQRGRVTYRALKLRYQLSDQLLAGVTDELIKAERVAADEDGEVLVWIGAPPVSGSTFQVSSSPFSAPSAQHPDFRRQMLDPRSTDGERRQLTVMFCDLVGSTALSTHLDPEELREVIRMYQQTCASAVSRFGGYLANYIGDGVLAYFGYPLAHEDDAQRAIRAGLGIVDALPELNTRLWQTVEVLRDSPLQVRMGIHTGLVVVGEMGGGGYRDPMAIVGETPNIAARLQGLAAPNTVMISASTQRLTQGFFECQGQGLQELKGVSVPLQVYRVQRESDVHSRFEVVVRTGLLPLVGRKEELEVLHGSWAKAIAGEGQIVLLSGEAGIGKSRLVQALKEHVAHQGGTRIEFRCSPYYQDSAFYPVTAQLQRLLQFEREDTPQEKLAKLERMLQSYGSALQEAGPLFAALLSLPYPEGYPPLNLTPQVQRHQTQEALGRWLVEEAKRTPVLAVWEDLQWADPSTLELQNLLADRLTMAPLLTVFTYRSEFSPPWATHPRVMSLTLSRFSQQHVEEMVGRVVGSRTLPAAVLQQIVAKTDGVPLFVEELTKMVVEAGLVRPMNNHYELTGPLLPLAIPSTLQDSLMARLDRLGKAKEIAQLGATLGRQFSYELLRVIAPIEEDKVKHALAELVKAEVLYEHGPAPHVQYLFKHALIQDAAYHSLLLQRRKELHKAVGAAIEDLYAEQLTEYQEELAYHYERGEAWEKALKYLVKTGQQLQQAYAHREALAHYDRALAVCERLRVAPEPATLIALYTGKGIAHGTLSERDASNGALRRLLAVARQFGDRVQEAQALSFLAVDFFWRHEYQKALDHAEQAKVVASEIGAKNILAETFSWMGLVHEGTGNLGEATRCYQESLRISREAGYKRVEGASLTRLGRLHNFMGGYEQALQLLEQAINIGQTHNLQDLLFDFFWNRGIAYCGKGEYEQALASLQEGLELSDRLGEKPVKCRILNTLGWVYGELYDLDRAIRYNKAGAEVSYTLGDPEIVRNAEINLGDAYLLLGDIEQAQQYLENVYRDSQQRGKWGEESMKWRYSQHCCHSLGELWLLKEDAEKALQFADECLNLAEPTESRKNIVKGWRLQGQAFCVQGRLAEAETVLQKAITLAKEIGNPPQLWKTYQALGQMYERQGATEQARSAYANAIEAIEGVASQLQDQELKRIFLSARPVQKILERRQIAE